MTKHSALEKAYRLWVAGHGITRSAITVQRFKSVVDRCEVGYRENGLSFILGRGPTWEIAFERALRPA